MTVTELVAALGRHPPDMPVYMEDHDEGNLVAHFAPVGDVAKFFRLWHEWQLKTVVPADVLAWLSERPEADRPAAWRDFCAPKKMPA